MAGAFFCGTGPVADLRTEPSAWSGKPAGMPVRPKPRMDVVAERSSCRRMANSGGWKQCLSDKTITGNIDLITKNINTNEYFVLDYKTSKYSKEKEDYYKPQLDTYKSMVQNVFNIENENKISTGLIFLK